MVRDFVNNPELRQISEVLEQFNLDYTARKSRIDVVRFEVLSPDSFVWRLRFGNAVYYLYAEDYIPGIDYVRQELTNYIGSDKWEFVRVEDGAPFEPAGPVKSAQIYQKPSRADDLMQYTAQSGYDFVFLAKTLENPDEAYFSDVREEPPRATTEMFRANVGIVIIKNDKVLVFERADLDNVWQLPQGGIDLGETPEDAARRELHEETGLGVESVELKGMYPEWLAYELPDELKNGKYLGQVQRWFVYELKAHESAINLEGNEPFEFTNYRWIGVDELESIAAPFRKPIYRQVALFIKSLNKKDI